MDSNKATITTSNEIVKFMNLTFKEWGTNDGIGKEASKFIYFNTLKFERQISNNTLPNDIILENMYSYITQDYIKRKEDYKKVFIKACIQAYFKGEFDNNETIKELADGFDELYTLLKNRQEYNPETYDVE